MRALVGGGGVCGAFALFFSATILACRRHGIIWTWSLETRKSILQTTEYHRGGLGEMLGKRLQDGKHEESRRNPTGQI